MSKKKIIGSLHRDLIKNFSKTNPEYKKGINLSKKSKYDDALISFQTCLLSTDNDIINAHIWKWIGHIYFKKKDYESSSSYYLKSLAVFQEEDNKSSHLNVLKRLGKLYYCAKDYGNALNYYDQCLNFPISSFSVLNFK